MNFAYIIIGTIFVTLYLASGQGGIDDPTEVNKIMSRVENTTFNITTNIIPYTSFYTNEITMKDMVFNFAHAIAYPIMVLVNTLIPITVFVTSGMYASLIYKLIIWFLVLTVLVKLPSIIKAIIAIYFFVKEKKKYKEKVHH